MKMFLRRRGVIAGIAIVALVVTACSGGGSESASDGSPVSTGGGAGGGTTALADTTQALGLIATPGEGTLDADGKELKVGARVGRLAPNFRLATPDGTPLALSDFRGKPVLINFWATWCGPCRFEMPELQAMHERLGDDLQVLAVDLDESSGDVRDFFEELGLTFTAVIDKDEDVANEYRLFGLPSTYIVDEDGIIRALKVGPFVDQDDLNKSLEKVGL